MNNNNIFFLNGSAHNNEALDTMADVNFALDQIHETDNLQDDDIVVVPAGKLRSAMELLLSLLAAHEKWDIDEMENMRELQRVAMAKQAITHAQVVH